MFSIYHFFQSLTKDKSNFLTVKHLADYPFDEQLLSCKNKGIFPDLAIRVNPEKRRFTGGELIELKDSKSYTVSSFNSTIPTGKKKITKIISGQNSRIKQQMEAAGDDVYSLPIRDVYYLIRGKKRGNTKVCLVHGSFFETIKVEELISQSFSQVLEERINETGIEIPNDVKKLLSSILSEQENFRKVRSVEKASVKLRFRIMSEVKVEGNILNSKKYPDIKDNTLNFVLPYHSDKEKREIIKKAKVVFKKKLRSSFQTFNIKHHFNGYFFVFQLSLT